MTKTVTAIGNRIAHPNRNWREIQLCSTLDSASRGRRLADRRGVSGGALDVGSTMSAAARVVAIGVPLLARRAGARGEAVVNGGKSGERNDCQLSFAGCDRSKQVLECLASQKTKKNYPQSPPRRRV